MARQPVCYASFNHTGILRSNANWYDYRKQEQEKNGPHACVIGCTAQKVTPGDELVIGLGADLGIRDGESNEEVTLVP